MIQLRTLGSIGIQKDGEELTGISTHKQKFALLAYLAVERRASRERLVAIFWPEREEEKARHSLSQALYALKRELGEEHLAIEGDSVALTDDLCHIDVRALERAAEEGRWDAALDLYAGPFLAQFSLPGAPEFENWQTITRTRLARLARRAFPQVIESQVADGEPAAALATAGRWVHVHPLEDEAHHALILLLARSGDRTGALEHYEVYRQRLRQELDVEPLDGTIELVESIRRGELPEFHSLAGAEATEPAEPGATPEPARLQESRAPYPAAVGPSPELQPYGPTSLLQELKQRRMFHIGAAYLAVAWLAVQLADTLVDRAMLPDWVFPATLLTLAFGLPIALIFAWAQETAPAVATADAQGPGRQLIELLRGGRVFTVLGVLVLLLFAGLFALKMGAFRVGDLREDRVMIFPLTVEPQEQDSAGDELAIAIGHSFQATGLFKYVDGWWGLNELQRAGSEELTPRSALQQARGERAGYYVQGRVALYENSVHVRTVLRSAADNSILGYGDSRGTLDPFWIKRQSDEVATQLLRLLVPEEQPIVLAAGGSDTAQAVLEFLKGEVEYRNARFGQALGRYNAAVALDSTYAMAALKGALAAGWQYKTDEAGRLISVATRRQAFLEPSTAQFARGLVDYYDGRADQAIEHFNGALAIDPDWPEAWAQLGETYTHLLPDTAPLDSLAEAAFQEARRHQIEFRPVLYHLIEFAVQRGDVQKASSLLADYAEAEPDSDYLAASALKVECAAGEPHAIDWKGTVERDPLAVYRAAQSLAKAGRRTDCARAGWSALLEWATGDAGENYRFGSLIGLQSLLVAEGRYEDLEDLWAAQPEFKEYAGDFFLLDAGAGAPTVAQAEAYAGQLRRRLPSDELTSFEIWMLGVREEENGRAGSVRALADTLAARAAASDDRLDRMLADVMAAHAALAAGDSAAALELFQALAPTKPRGEIWWPWETLAGERVTLAELLYGRGRYAEAARVAASLDAPARPATDLIYLPASLAIRARAARALGDVQLERRSRERLTHLGRTDLIEDLDS